jgi:preprotein translocase subunit YajC
VASLILIVAMFVLLWVLLIRPQRQRQQQQQRMIEAIDPGDEILTVGGIYGIVEEIDDEDDLVVEIAEGIRVRVSRRAVASVVKPEEEEEDEETGSDGQVGELPEAEAPTGRVEAVKDGEQVVRDEAAEGSAEPSRR